MNDIFNHSPVNRHHEPAAQCDKSKNIAVITIEKGKLGLLVYSVRALVLFLSA